MGLAFRCATGVLLLLVTGKVYSQTNNWTNHTSAQWEEPFWSLGTLPSASHTVHITNPGWKAVAISSTTATLFPDALTISNLLVAAPAGSRNTLLLNFAGAKPLTVDGCCEVGTNGSLHLVHSSLVAGALLTGDSPALHVDGDLLQESGSLIATNGMALINGTMQSQGQASFRQLAINGAITNLGGNWSLQSSARIGGTWSIQGGTVSIATNLDVAGRLHQSGGTLRGHSLRRERPGTVHQSGGELAFDEMNANGFLLSNGLCLVRSMEVNSRSWILGDATAAQYGGQIVVTNTFDLWGYDDGGFPPLIWRSSFEQHGGIIQTAQSRVGPYSRYEQNAGLHRVLDTLNIHGGEYYLRGGVLSCTAGTLAPYSVPYRFLPASFIQTGGTNLCGTWRGSYQLEGGTFLVEDFIGTLTIRTNAPAVIINPGTFAIAGQFNTGGTSQNLGPLQPLPQPFQSAALLDLQKGPCILRFANSSAMPWTNTSALLVTNWAASDLGLAPTRVFFGTDHLGLNPDQLRRVTFVNPAGLLPGSYAAQLSPSGELLPLLPGQLAQYGSSTGFETSPPPPDSGSLVAIAAGARHCLALQRDGRVIGWGDPYFATPPANVSNVIAIAASAERSLLLRTDGTVLDWGYFQQFPPPGDLRDVIAIASGHTHQLALRADGTVVQWGASTNVPAGLSNVVSLAVGPNNVALLGNGRVVSWDSTGTTATNLPGSLTNVSSVHASDFYHVALKEDGTVVAWGPPFWFATPTNVPPDLSNVVAIAAGRYHCLALKDDGSVVGWGTDYAKESSGSSAFTNVVEIAAGNGFSLLLLSNQPSRAGVWHTARSAPGDGARFTLDAEPSHHYLVQRSIDLAQWAYHGHLRGASNSVMFPTAKQAPKAFIRARRVR